MDAQAKVAFAKLCTSQVTGNDPLDDRVLPFYAEQIFSTLSENSLWVSLQNLEKT